MRTLLFNFLLYSFEYIRYVMDKLHQIEKSGGYAYRVVFPLTINLIQNKTFLV